MTEEYMYVALFWGKVRPEWQNTEYAAIGARMFERASSMPGFAGLHKFDVPDGRELAIAYFETEAQMADWYNDPEHRAVETLGRRDILDDYTIEILEMTRSYTKESSTFRATPEDELAADELAASVQNAVGQ
ncbi:antibiotic biosynthesis monooxygenase family protein [Nocardia sp. R16R-3T]